MNATKRRLDDIIVVDAIADDYALLFEELRRCEFKVSLYAAGETALAAVDASANTLWMVNVQLPDMSGVGFLVLVRRRFRRSNVFLVGNSYSTDDEVAARLAGATAYVCKPPTIAWLHGSPLGDPPAARASPASPTSTATIKPP